MLGDVSSKLITGIAYFCCI